MGGEGLGKEEQRVGDWGEITLGEIPNVDDRGDGCNKPQWHMYTYVTNLHVLHVYPRT